MAKYYVTKVRKERVTKEGNSHKHIIGVFREDATSPTTNQQVVDSINAGNDWYTKVKGEPNAKIRSLDKCTNKSCSHKPYLTTAPDHTEKNNLENLPEG